MKVKFFKIYQDLPKLEKMVNEYTREHLKKSGNPEIFDIRFTTEKDMYFVTVTHN